MWPLPQNLCCGKPVWLACPDDGIWFPWTRFVFNSDEVLANHSTFSIHVYNPFLIRLSAVERNPDIFMNLFCQQGFLVRIWLRSIYGDGRASDLLNRASGLGRELDVVRNQCIMAH
jgi:hypothetical protein